MNQNVKTTVARKRIYIAGPMKGIEGFNYPAFNRAERTLRKLGWEVVNPATFGDAYGTPDEINSDRQLLHRLMNDELRELAKCDAIYLLRGWEKSMGARGELGLAIHLNLEIVEQRVTR